MYLCFTNYAKAFDCVCHNKLWKTLKEIGILDHFTCLLRNLYAGQEATVSTLYGTTDWFRIEKGVQQGCLLSPCLFNLYTEQGSYEMLGWMGYKLESRLLESISLRYVDDTTRMAESKKELKSLLMRVTKEGEKANLKPNIKETKIMASSPITSWQTEGENLGAVIDFFFPCSKITADGDCSHEIR